MSPSTTGNSGSLDEAALSRFLAHCQHHRYRKKQIVIRPGEAATSLYYIIEGSVSVVSEGEDGGEIVLAYLNAGSFIGEMGLFFPPERRSVTVRARSVCEIAEITYDHLNQLFKNELRKEHAHILHGIGLQLAQRLLHTTRKVNQLAFMDASGRVARILLELCEQPDAMSHPEGTQLHISRQEIGRIVGCSREIAGRVLKSMNEQGLISVSGMTIVVRHPR